MKRSWRRVVPLLALAVFGAGLVGRSLVDRFTLKQPTYSQIEDSLYLGGYLWEPPPGARAVLNVCKTPDPYQAEVHRWEPIRNAEPGPSMDWLRRQTDFIEAQRSAGLPVFVHCHGGVSRSAFVVVAYLMRRNGWTRDQALAFVSEKRPVVCLNPVFLRQLQVWEAALGCRRAAGRTRLLTARR